MLPNLIEIFKAEHAQQALRANDKSLRDARASGDPMQVQTALEKSVADLSSTVVTLLGIVDALIDEVDRRTITPGR